MSILQQHLRRVDVPDVAGRTDAVWRTFALTGDCATQASEVVKEPQIATSEEMPKPQVTSLLLLEPSLHP